eukprot:3157324-Amphidinium_carterae.1
MSFLGAVSHLNNRLRQQTPLMTEAFEILNTRISMCLCHELAISKRSRQVNQSVHLLGELPLRSVSIKGICIQRCLARWDRRFGVERPLNHD